MKITMLGTGNASVSKCYNTCFVISDDKKHFLVDGGGGNQILHQLDEAGIDLMEISDIFVTHTHIDHILGILWVMRIICPALQRSEREVRIYGHDKVINMLRELSSKMLHPKQTRSIDRQLKFVEVKDGETKNIIGHDVTFFDIRSDKDKQFGFSMMLDDKEKLTCLGDEPYYKWNKKYAQGSKWLLHEAFCLYEDREIFHPYEKFHSTVIEACKSAEELGVKNLLLYHTEDKNLSTRKEKYTAEGSPYFSGNLYVPDDLEVLNL